ncbi:RWP-RK domain-containing protein [Tribonema minus]|uniref:RWP-RK domain-containing protein n=1 Tax=Tribonema minus TaxID=303371 RepID=A0A835YTV5_9STRA|nr:RWP-RK domain-containing protein [Tribonema minus]
MTRAKLEVLFDRPVEQAARALGVSSTIIKRLCRRHGIPKWPYRQLLRIGELRVDAFLTSRPCSPTASRPF